MPFLIQSDSASRKRPFWTGHFLDWILLVLLLIVSRVKLKVFVLLLEAVGVREYCCMALENRLSALELRAFFAGNACFTRDEPLSKRAGGFGPSRKPLELRSWYCTQSTKSRQSYSRRSRCWQSGIDNARYCCRCCRVIHAAGERS